MEAATNVKRFLVAYLWFDLSAIRPFPLFSIVLSLSLVWLEVSILPMKK